MDRVELARRLGAHPRAVESRSRVVNESDPTRFMAAFTEAVAEGGDVFLADPFWGERERAQFNALVCRPGNARHRAGVANHGSETGWLCIPTGGSSGAVKLARHDEETIAAAVHGFTTHFAVRGVNAIGLLPMHHVSGLMAWLRCVLSGGRYRPWDWKALEAGDRPEVGPGDWFLSLVPTQLQRLLTDRAAVDWLKRFQAVFIGGGPAWPELIERSAELRLPLAFSYGMTETAAMVTALRPGDFLTGTRGSGKPLAHARVTLGEDGGILIDSPSLFRGYWPEGRGAGPWATSDLGWFDPAGSLHILGRRDALIISGGEKIDPQEVEAVLRSTGAFVDVAVLGVPDSTWGQIVVACYTATMDPIDHAAIERTLSDRLAKFKWPKRYVLVDPWPRNAQGKLIRAELLKRLE
jgi:o-succinylbenzoate---CoA ligase